MKVTFQDKEYKSLSECYRENKESIEVSLFTVRERIKSGISIDDALLTPNQNRTEPIGSHVVEGVEYPSLPSIAEVYSMTSDAVYKRYSRGYRGDDLVPLKKRKHYVHQQKENKSTKTEIIVNGKKYKSAMQACAKLGVPYVTFRKRLKRGQSIEQALGVTPFEDKRHEKRERIKDDPLENNDLGTHKEAKISQHNKRSKKQKRELIVLGRVFKSYKELAEAYSLSYAIVYQRITDYGYTPEEAVMLEGRSKKVIVEGKEHKSKAEVAKAYGITLPILLGRMNNGQTIEQALGIEIPDTTYTINYEGRKYRNLEDLAVQKGISVKALRSRLAAGYTLEQAINAGERIFNKGKYNKKILQRDSELAKRDALLYFVKLTEHENYYKLGITAKGIENRLKDVKFETIATIDDSLENVYELEQSILSLTKYEKANISAESLDGYTEVRELIDDEVELIVSLIQEYKMRKNS